MKKLYTLREASDYLGLTESTLRGWINETHLSVVMMGRTMYIDSESLEDLKCPTEGVVRLKRAIDSLKSKQVSELRRVRQNALTETVFRKFLSECSDKCVMYGLFQTLLRLLNNSGEITDREFRVLSSLLAGDSMTAVATRMNILRDEIKDICLNALDKVRKTRKSLSELKDGDSDKKKLETILSTPISECPGLSVRTRNVLRFNRFENGYLTKGETATIGELVALRREDVWQMRNCGRKTVEELDNLIAGFGLRWKEKSPGKRRIIKKK